MAVITPTGIVGKVVQVFPDASQVLPINDQFSGVGAALKSSRLQGILKGSPNGATTLQYVMSDEKVEPGEEVITSGGDRIFPKGLPVGKVVSVEPGKDLFLNIRVVPAARLDQVEEVLVVTNILEKQPDSKELGPLRVSDILAERLPTVPPKPDVDAAGNSKPDAANGTTTSTVPAASAGATAGHSAPTGTPVPNKPGPGGSAASPKPNATPAATAPGATTGSPKTTKPTTAVGTHPAGTNTKPLNGTGNTTVPKTNGTTPKAAPSPGNGATSGEDATPAPKQVKPIPEQAPSNNPQQQPSTPPAGEQPPQ